MADELQPIIIKKKKAGHAGPHGGAWKLAYADFVTAMMAFFLVMWIIGMDVKTKAGLAEYFSNPGAFKVNFQSSPYALKLDGRPPGSAAKVEESSRRAANIDPEAAEALAATIESTLQSEGLVPRMSPNISIKITDDGLRIDLMETSTKGAIFDPGGSELRPDCKRLLQTIAPRLIGSRKGISIEGHTSSRAPPGAKWDVSLERAANARRELARIGVRSEDIQTVSGKADTQLKIPESPGALANDRITIVVPMDKN